jgi:hypothetical protein
MTFDAYQRTYAYSGLEEVIKAEMVNDVWLLDYRIAVLNKYLRCSFSRFFFLFSNL